MNHGLTGLLQVWSRRKWLAILFFAAPFTAAVTLAMSLPDIYKATAALLVERQQVAETFVKSAVTGEIETRLRMITEEIWSRARLQELIIRFGLYPSLMKHGPLEDVIDRMRRDIQTESEKEAQQMGGRVTVAFTISYLGRDPQTVALVANTLASMYVEENLKMRGRQASGTAQFLQVQLEQMKQKLDVEEHRVGQFKERYLGELPEQMQANLSAQERLNTELRMNIEGQMRVKERLEREEVTRQLVEATAVGRVGDPLGPIGGPDAMAARIARLNQDLMELRTRASEKHPDVIRVKAEIVALEHKLAEMKQEESSAPNSAPKPSAPTNLSHPRHKKVRSEVEVELSALQEQEKALRHAIATYQRRIESAPHREQEYQELSRNYKTTKELYNTLLQRYEEAQVSERMEQGQKGDQFRVLDPAIVPVDPEGPNRNKLLLIGLVLSLALAAGVVVLAEQLDASFHTVEDLRAFTKVPLLVSIPRIVTETDTNRRHWKVGLGSAAAMVGLVFIIGASYYLAHGNDEIVLKLVRAHS